MMTAKVPDRVHYTPIGEPALKNSLDQLERYLFLILIPTAIVLAVFLVWPKPIQPIQPLHQTVTVETGQTLWSIESTEYGQAINPWDGVEAIERANGIQDAGDLKVGQAITLPTLR